MIDLSQASHKSIVLFPLQRYEDLLLCSGTPICVSTLGASRRCTKAEGAEALENYGQFPPSALCVHKHTLDLGVWVNPGCKPFFRKPESLRGGFFKPKGWKHPQRWCGQASPHFPDKRGSLWISGGWAEDGNLDSGAKVPGFKSSLPNSQLLCDLGHPTQRFLVLLLYLWNGGKS